MQRVPGHRRELRQRHRSQRGKHLVWRSAWPSALSDRFAGSTQEPTGKLKWSSSTVLKAIARSVQCYRLCSPENSIRTAICRATIRARKADCRTTRIRWSAIASRAFQVAQCCVLHCSAVNACRTTANGLATALNATVNCQSFRTFNASRRACVHCFASVAQESKVDTSCCSWCCLGSTSLVSTVAGASANHCCLGLAVTHKASQQASGKRSCRLACHSTTLCRAGLPKIFAFFVQTSVVILTPVPTTLQCERNIHCQTAFLFRACAFRDRVRLFSRRVVICCCCPESSTLRRKIRADRPGANCWLAFRALIVSKSQHHAA